MHPFLFKHIYNVVFAIVVVVVVIVVTVIIYKYQMKK